MKRRKTTPEEKRVYKERLKTLLMQHVGSTRKIGMGELYEQTFQRSYDHRINDTRPLRKLIDELRDEGLPIPSKRSRNNGGYFLASAGSELDDYCEELLSEGLKKFSRVAKYRNKTLPALMGQMQLNLVKRQDGNENRDESGA